MGLPFSQSFPLAVGRAADPPLGLIPLLDQQSCNLQCQSCKILIPIATTRLYQEPCHITYPVCLPSSPALTTISPFMVSGQCGPLALAQAAFEQEAPGCSPFIGQVETMLLAAVSENTALASIVAPGGKVLLIKIMLSTLW